MAQSAYAGILRVNFDTPFWHTSGLCLKDILLAQPDSSGRSSFDPRYHKRAARGFWQGYIFTPVFPVFASVGSDGGCVR